MKAPDTMPPHHARSRAWLLLLLVALLLGGMAWGLSHVYQEREQRYRHQIEGSLQAVNQLQLRAVTDWRARRMAEAAALTQDSLFARAVAQWRGAPSSPQQAALRERLTILMEQVRYTAAYLVDAQMRIGSSYAARLLHPVQPGRVLEGEVLPPESELMSRGRQLLDDIARETRAIENIARR